MKKLIIFLIRRRLRLEKYEEFQFSNQKTKNVYFFTETSLLKVQPLTNGHILMCESGVSLNWLLNKECRVNKLYGN